MHTNVGHVSRRGTRRRVLLLGSALALATGVLVVAPTSALPAGIFELDANVADAAGGGDDWASLFADNTPPAGSSAAFTGIIDDFPAAGATDQTTFTGGHSKDDLRVEGASLTDLTDGWLHVPATRRTRRRSRTPSRPHTPHPTVATRELSRTSSSTSEPTVRP